MVMNLSNLITRIFCLFFGLALLPQLGTAHGDEIPNDPGISKDHFTVYGQSERYELTLYYPELEAKKAVHLTLYLIDRAIALVIARSIRPSLKSVL